MNRQKAGQRPTAGGSKSARGTEYGPADWDQRPAKKSRAARPDPDGYDFYDEEDFYEAKKPARGAAPKKPAPRSGGAPLPFGDDGFDRDPRPVRSGAAYGERPVRKGRDYEDERPAPKSRAYEEAHSARRVREMDADFPGRPARGYGEELPVRKKARAQSPRPADFDRYNRPGRDDFYEYDRPARRAPAKSGRRKKKSGGMSTFLYWAIAIVLALLIGFGVRTFGFELIKVKSDAMAMTLIDGETVMLQKSVYYSSKPARGDIVGVNSPDGLLIRRVVALPGETIEIKGEVTYVNDEPLEESYVSQKGGGDYPLTTIPDGCYFVMGDNRVNTDDSRTFGLIKNTRSLIVGKVNSIVWPLDQWGTIK